MFGTGLVVRLRRALSALRAPPPPTRAAVTAAAAAAPTFLRADLDWELLARTAETRFERLYYGHRGPAMFKWRQYLPLYDRVLAPYVGTSATLVEIGIATGASLKLWRAFLGPECRIIGVDIDPGARVNEGPGVEIMIGDQGDPDFLRQIAERAGSIDILIDDGSHQVGDQILTLETLFPVVRDGGVFVCEDLHTSYWASFGGGPGRTGTFIEYLKSLIDRLHAPYAGVTLAPNDLARSVGRLELADSIVVLHKAAPSENYMVQVGG